ncbi:MAG: phosphoglucosamine mutase, partial [Deltaproteobacteria bacterium]|nr:phosphoglucosamine mutase [Deltaproteobacteria bacterium]
AKDLISRRALKRRTVAATVMSNLGLEKALSQMGARLVRTQVGDRYVVAAMRQRKLNLGGEQSGHLIFLDHNTTGDGILSTLMLLSVMLREDRSLTDLADVMETFPQLLLNLKVGRKTPLAELKALPQAIKEVEAELGDQGRVLVRYSGTEALLRIMVEAESDAIVRQAAESLAATAKSELG